MKNKILNQTEKLPAATISLNDYLDKLTMKDYKEKVRLLKNKLAWSDSLFYQKKSGAVKLSLSDQIAIESILNAEIF